MGDVVHGDRFGVFHIGNAIEVQGAGDCGDADLDQGGTVAQLEHLAGLDVLFGQAYNGGIEFAGGRGALRAGEEIAAGKIDVVGKQECHGIAGGGGVGGAIGSIYLGDGAGAALGQADLVAHGNGTGLHAAGVAAVIGGVLTDDILDGETEIQLIGAAGGHGDGLENLEDGWSGVPLHGGGTLNHVIAFECRNRHDGGIGDV